MIFNSLYTISSQKERNLMLNEIISKTREKNGLSLSFVTGERHPGILRSNYDQTVNLHNNELISLDFDGEDGILLENASDALIAALYDKIIQL